MPLCCNRQSMKFVRERIMYYICGYMRVSATYPMTWPLPEFSQGGGTNRLNISDLTFDGIRFDDGCASSCKTIAEKYKCLQQSSPLTWVPSLFGSQSCCKHLYFSAVRSAPPLNLPQMRMTGLKKAFFNPGRRKISSCGSKHRFFIPPRPDGASLK